MKFSYRILADVDIPGQYAFQVKDEAGKSYYLSEFEFSDPETATSHADQMIIEILRKQPSIKKSTTDSKVVGIFDKKSSRQKDELLQIIGQDGYDYIYTTANLTDPILSMMKIDVELSPQDMEKVQSALGQEIGRVLEIVNAKLSGCREGFYWFMIKHPGEVPPVPEVR